MRKGSAMGALELAHECNQAPARPRAAWRCRSTRACRRPSDGPSAAASLAPSASLRNAPSSAASRRVKGTFMRDRSSFATGMEEARPVEVVVEQSAPWRHSPPPFSPAHPLVSAIEHQSREVDGIGRRRVGHRVALSLHFVVEASLACPAAPARLDPHARSRSRDPPDRVLLRAGVDQAVAATSIGRDRICDDISATSGTPCPCPAPSDIRRRRWFRSRCMCT